MLARETWQPYRDAANAAALLIEWIDGAPLSTLEGRFQDLRAGTIEALGRDVAWCLSGLADIVSVSTARDIRSEERPRSLRTANEQTLFDARRLLPSLRLLSWRLAAGLPATVLWLNEAQGRDGRAMVSRKEALALLSCGLSSYELIRRRESWGQLIDALRGARIRDAQARAELIRKLADEWHMSLRERMLERQCRHAAPEVANLLQAFYHNRGSEFEQAFEALLTFSNIQFTRFDTPPKKGAFDYIIKIEGRPELPVECKSRQGNNLVALNEATDVLRATELHGYSGSSCVTLCQPGVDPNVLTELVRCARLSVVEVHDLAEVLLLVGTKKALPHEIYDWLTQPGHAKIETFVSVKPSNDE